MKAVRSDGLRKNGEHPRVATVSEAEVWALLGTEGLSNKEIADRLHVSSHTVRAELRSLMAKYKVDNRTQLALLYRDAQRGSA